MLDVLLVATRTEKRRAAASGGAGVRIDRAHRRCRSFRIGKCLRLDAAPDAGRRLDRTVAVVDFGASKHHVQRTARHAVIYTRDLRSGASSLTEEIMRTYGLSMEEAGRAKKEGVWPSNISRGTRSVHRRHDPTGQPSLQFYLASGSGRSQPDQILICGGCANIPGVADVISSRVGVPADKGDPLGNMRVSSKAKAQASTRGRHGNY